ncbi:MAG: FAD-dependent oxidoreductase [Spirochaetota bacterium]|nr:FAD-dependent oxidoreductase [Spirochaetota bacterium]
MNETIDKTNGCVGAVMVVGGGIGGIQASLDLSNSGFKVYLVEETTSIGGRMSQLDKTFPTNDCSMCIISPKLVEVGKDRNIEVITYSSVEEVEGEAGNFRVKILERPRYIDLEKCTGCGECAKNCPVEMPNEFNVFLDYRNAVYKRYPQAIPNAFAINKNDRAPCVMTCPANTNVQGYIALVAKEKFEEAYNVIIDRNPLPSICGRVCHHPCEGECNRGQIDEPVAINNIKRFVANRVREDRKASDIKVERAEIDLNRSKTAVIGGGPSGLTCARDLIQDGYPVTIFEAEDKLGGAMRYGIPDYRLPKEYLDWDIQNIIDLGIDVKTGERLGKDFTIESLKDKGYKAVYIGVGLPCARRIPFKGSDQNGVIWGIDFLKEVNLGKNPRIGKDVVVIGGGNVAIDVAMTAKRQGGERVAVVSLESREEMPAHEWEILDAVEEGIELNPSWGPDEILGEDGNVTGIRLNACTRVFDNDGKFNPEFDYNRKSEIETDTIIIAIGQAADLDWIGDNSPIERQGGGIKADALTLATNIEGVFAGGDVVYGPKSVVEAIDHGHRAAESIKRYIQGEDIAQGREIVEKKPAELPDERPYLVIPRHYAQKADINNRSGNYNEIEYTFTQEMAVAEAKRCLDCGICCECLQCLAACQADAIKHDDIPRIRNIDVGSIILIPGFDPFDASIKGRYGYGRFENVVTSLQFERILSASGPFEGEVMRPSDNSHPRKVAWIQCVGSRDTTCDNDYCSSVCCMYATKEAIIAREHDNRIEPTIFYMDIRAFGKEFDSYYERARDEHGVRFIRSMVSDLEEDPDNDNIIIKYINETGSSIREEFDLVVLSIGMVPSQGAINLSKKLEIDIDRYGFCETSTFEPLNTSRDGIYVSGVFQSPKDIPETVAQSSGAAAYAESLLFSARGEMIEEVEYPPERDITGEDPRIGVFVCHCGINIGGVVNVPSIKEYALTLPDVVFADENLYTCSQDTQQKIRDAIIDNNLNRVIVASCSPRTHEPLFQSTIREAGLNRYLFEMANIRDQCSWVHQQEKERATEKARDLVRMAVANARLLSPLQEQFLDVTHKGLVIGGGLAGMHAALRLAEQGFDVTLVEKESELGGNLKDIYYTIHGDDVQAYLDTLVKSVESHERIIVVKNAVIDNFEGYKGNFVTSLLIGPAMRTMRVEHGITIVATGAEESKPKEYLYGENDRVLTQMEFENRIVNNKDSIKDSKEFVMIQCVGSRNEERPYCSRVCCSVAIKNALKIKGMNPDARVYILYRDIRTYGLLEEYYTKAREMGVIFIRYDLDNMPEVTDAHGTLSVSVNDPVLGLRIEINPDILILSSATIPRENEELSTMLKIDRTRDDFYLEAHMKLRPVDFANDGIYMCGMAHNPKLIDETISQAAAAAARAAIVLSKDKLQADAVIAQVNPELCAACLTCVRVCSNKVPFINNDGVAEINPALCRGCGSCASDCPGKAIELQHFRDAQLIAKCEESIEYIKEIQEVKEVAYG